MQQDRFGITDEKSGLLLKKNGSLQIEVEEEFAKFVAVVNNNYLFVEDGESKQHTSHARTGN